MKNLKWAKLLAGFLTAVMIVALMPVNNAFAEGEDAAKDEKTVGYSVVDASTLHVDVDFYDYNITTYNEKKLDSNTKIALNAYQKEHFSKEGVVSGSSITEKNLFLFGGDRKNDGKTGAHNIWTGSGKAQYQGIVKNKLDSDGNLVFNNDAGIYSVNIFPQEGDTALEEAGAVETYYHTNFQFLNEDGTYVYDSEKHAAYGLTKDADNNGVIKTDFTKRGPIFGRNMGKGNKEYGFFPFNNVKQDSLDAADSRHHMFGMKMELNFFMPEGGEIGTESNPNVKKDMIFEFSGDDDVWVFVDGHLVLDLGGIHDATGGKINFATGDVTYDRSTTGGIETKVDNMYKSYNIVKDNFSEHTLTMFYLERGEYDSNCKISFNMPTVVTNEDISIKKKVENAPENSTDTYDFKLLYGSDKDDVINVYEGTYDVHDSTNAYVKEVNTSEDGVITLAAGETAVIGKDKIKGCEYYQVEEINTTEEYDTSWITTGDNGAGGDGTTTKVIEKNTDGSGSHIEFTNKYHVPEMTVTPGATTSPAISSSPAVTEEPEASETPEVSATPEIQGTPDVTTTPEKTDIPKATATPFVTRIPQTDAPHTGTPTTEIPETEIPSTGAPTTEVPETEAPTTKVPTTEVPETEIPATKEPTPSVPATEIPATRIPQTNIPATKVPEVEIPDGDIPEDPPVTDTVAPTGTPVTITTPDLPAESPVTGTNPPVGEVTPEETNLPTTKEPVTIDEDTQIPNEPVGVSTKKPEKDTPSTTKIPNHQSDNDSTIIEDNIPGELPQTGGIGVLDKKSVENKWWILVPVFAFVAGSVSILFRRKKNKKSL